MKLNENQKSPNVSLVQPEFETPLAQFCNGVPPRRKGENYWDGAPTVDDWQKQCEARDKFDEHMQHDITFKK